MTGFDTAHDVSGEALPATTDLGPVPETAAPLAYSDHTSSISVVEYQPPRSRSVWIAGLVIVAAGCVAIAAFVLGRATAPQPSAAAPVGVDAPTAGVLPPPVPPSPAAPVPPSAPAAPPPAVAAPVPVAPAAPVPTGPDAGFLNRIHTDGVPYRSGDDDAIVTAHLVCNGLSDGLYDSMQDQADSFEQLFGWTAGQSWDFVAAAVRFYCPHNAR